MTVTTVDNFTVYLHHSAAHRPAPSAAPGPPYADIPIRAHAVSSITTAGIEIVMSLTVKIGMPFAPVIG